ncbi:MAG TPA: class I SAM-dependent methyltransferase family protein [Nitrososphaeraceae archaeon]|nr:class I SAM-dependent methyltransferase family protein [Nitrososphaeraceae archaeon]
MTKMLKEILQERLDSTELEKLSSSFDIIGTIAIIKIPESLTSKRKLIADALIEEIRPVKSVFCQVSAIEGDYRLRKLELISGENSPITEYKEHGCTFKVDVINTYFSPRLSTERLRIAKLTEPNEVVVNMFGGVGTFSIIISRYNKSAKVYSIDSNPIAIDMCRQNIEINKLTGNVFPVLGDAEQEIHKGLKGIAKRVLMPLPEKAKDFVDAAVSSLENGSGTIHYFCHVGADNKKNAIQNGIMDTSESFSKFDHTIRNVRVVREVGPRFYQIVSDVMVT